MPSTSVVCRYAKDSTVREYQVALSAELPEKDLALPFTSLPGVIAIRVLSGSSSRLVRVIVEIYSAIPVVWAVVEPMILRTLIDTLGIPRDSGVSRRDEGGLELIEELNGLLDPVDAIT